jgi:hypothetical protein
MKKSFLLTILIVTGIPLFLIFQKITSKAEIPNLSNDSFKCKNEQCNHIKPQKLSSQNIPNNIDANKPKKEINEISAHVKGFVIQELAAYPTARTVLKQSAGG